MMNTHLSLDDRITISHMLSQQCSFKQIALAVGRNCTSISREVRNHIIFKKTGGYGRCYNTCLHRMGCSHSSLCPSCSSSRQNMSLIPLILTDNGSEFSNPGAIESDRQEIRERAFFTVILPHPDRKAPPRRTMNSSAMFSQKKLPLTHWSRLISPCSWTISILTAGRAWAINALMKCLNSFMDQEPFRHWEFTEFQQMK